MERYTYPQSVRLVATYSGAVTAPALALRPPRGARQAIAAASLTADGNERSYVVSAPMVGTWAWTWTGTVGGVTVAASGKFRVEPGA